MSNNRAPISEKEIKQFEKWLRSRKGKKAMDKAAQTMNDLVWTKKLTT